jgi:hypothetical protein
MSVEIVFKKKEKQTCVKFQKMTQAKFHKLIRSIVSFCYSQVSFSELPDELLDSIKSYIKTIPLKISVCFFISTSWISEIRSRNFEDRGSFN